MLVLLLLSPLILGYNCNAEVVWSEDFDGDLEGWFIVQGNFSVEDGTLRSTHEKMLSSSLSDLSVIWHPSRVSVGTWSWDWMFDSLNESPELIVSFFSLTQHGFSMGQIGKNYGIYCGHLEQSELWLYENDKFPGSEAVLGRYSSTKGTRRGVWHHVDVTRNEDGLFRVYADGVLVMETENNRYTEPVSFGVMLEHSWRGDSVVDNIIVSNTIDIDPSMAVEEEKQQGIPGFPFESILAGLIAGALIIWMVQRRR
jgi:hypothetical protein